MKNKDDDTSKSSADMERFKPDLSRFLDRTVDNYTLIGVMGTTEAQRMAGHLTDRGVTIELVFNPTTCTRGTCSTSGACSTSSEVWVHQADMTAVQQFMAEEHHRVYGDLSFDPAIVSQVFDPEKTEAVCPACGTPFSTQLAECPECGLGFGVGGP